MFDDRPVFPVLDPHIKISSKTPTNKKKQTIIYATEAQEAIALMGWVNTQKNIRDYFIHIPNEGKRSFYAGKKLKREGLKKGVSDYFLAYPVRGWHGLWIELKRQNAYPTAEQMNWNVLMNSCGYVAYIAYGAEMAINFIKNYLKYEAP